MNSAEQNIVRINVFSVNAEFIAVSGKIGNLNDFPCLVAVGENGCICFFFQFQDFCGFGNIALSGIGQNEAVAQLPEQLLPEFSLQVLQKLGECRLRDIQRVGSFCNILCFGNRY